MATTESKLGDFAEDLGKLLGTAEAKAKGWLAQPHQITKTLEGIRDTTNGLLRQLGNRAPTAGSPRAEKRERPKRKRWHMSPAQRKAVGKRMKQYWARRRKASAT